MCLRKSPPSKGKLYFKKIQLGTKEGERQNHHENAWYERLWAVRWVAVFRRMKRTNYEGIQAEFTLEEEGRGGLTVPRAAFNDRRYARRLHSLPSLVLVICLC